MKQHGENRSRSCGKSDVWKHPNNRETEAELREKRARGEEERVTFVDAF